MVCKPIRYEKEDRTIIMKQACPNVGT